METKSFDSEDPVQTYTYVVITRYITAAALVILIYDHLLSLGSEVKLIWPVKRSAPKMLFLWIRYTVPIALITYNVQLSQLVPQLELSTALRFLDKYLHVSGREHSSHEQFFNHAATLGYLGSKSQAYDLDTITFCAGSDRGSSRHIVLGLGYQAEVVWSPNPAFHMCGFEGTPPPIAILWAPGTAFEIVLCVLTWWNVMTQPRTSNAPLAAAIYRDGFMYFLLLLCIRIINTILAARAPPALILVAMVPVWCATTTTTCRLMIKLRQIDHNHDQIRPNDISDESIGVMVHDEYDELVQSGVHVEMLRSVGPSTPIRSSGTHY